MNLFIDDIRFPHQADPPVEDVEWTIARDYVEAMNIIQEHKPQRIAFDHDLAIGHYGGQYGPEKTGYDVANDLVDLDIYFKDFITEDFKFSCHSANPDGKRRIINLLSRYMFVKFNQKNRREQ